MSELVIKFNKPYKFEGKEYKEVNLSKIENLTTGDLIQADAQFSSTGNFSVMNEMTTGYSCIIASRATDKPIEFFEGLPAREGLRVKNVIMGFLNG